MRWTPGLDGMRGFALFLIIPVHLHQVVPELIGVEVITGAIGLDMFFVLSGFLITALLLNEDYRLGRIRIGAFYRRRAMRLLPPLYAMLIVFVIYAAVTDLPVINLAPTLWGVGFYYFNWLTVWGVTNPFTVPELNHLWSLSVEEQFYLVWPLIMLFIGIRRSIERVVAVLLSLIAVIVVLRTYMWEGTNWYTMYVRTDLRADTLLVGALLAQLWVRRLTPTRWANIAGCIGLVGFVLCLKTPSSSGFFFLGGYTWVGICAALVTWGVMERGWFAVPFEFIVFRTVGRVSYGIYLWHVPIFQAVARYGGDIPPVPRMLLALTLTGIAATLSWFLIEQPFLRWKDRIEKRERAKGPQPAGTTLAPAS